MAISWCGRLGKAKVSSGEKKFRKCDWFGSGRASVPRSTRGKRVTAEATIPRDVLVTHMRVTPEQLHYHATVGTIGAILAGASNNGAHSPNGITAIFIATGQDVAAAAILLDAAIASAAARSGPPGATPPRDCGTRW